jgi:ABC-type nitrate/sulfonate/bicarbonate transport system substrate-binding protein
VALAGSGGLSAFLAACGSSSKPSSSPRTPAGGSPIAAEGNFGTLDYQLSWIKTDEFAGEYLADSRGYYLDQGFGNVNLISGGPNVQPDTVVASGRAFVGISSPDVTSPAILQGADLVTIGAQYQKNPFRIMSLASEPIRNPSEMVGKKIGVQSTNESVWKSFLKANNIDPSTITEVPVQFDPTPLTTGTVDGWFSFITNEANLLKAKGFDTTTFLLADYNYPLVSETYIVRKSSLATDRDKVKAVLVADIKGWHDSIADPAAGPQLAVTRYGSNPASNEAEQVLDSRAQNELVLTSDTMVNGIFTITADLMQKSISTLAIGGITITSDKLFDLSVIDEVYQEQADLKTAPIPG